VDLHRIYDEFKDRADFLTIYISEAHPEDEWQMDSNREEHFVFKQPKTFEERRGIAKVLVDRLHYRIPVAVDTLDGSAEKAFAAWPERIYILGVGGRIAYKGAPGPFGFLPDEAERELRRVATGSP
jgi:type I thyroxine 5'-deiodinase